ncbi:TRAP transporter substrate-binding protein [Neptunomonas antarctica]|uniref:TRAP-type C4-dicarboxylate transport system, substrate-binding protein n=1 Tax=Neptunomonas antarctica TaxID=619304 RepID=A0A1N7KIM7_9GAMM|nr:TRAP transporter substrate-binding protein [Neptunomonas antarctica]SIS61458.1 TRAP-type C4-dicarboxylate transport system, substrate-binding protein [Neptunomonas antarctica]
MKLKTMIKSTAGLSLGLLLSGNLLADTVMRVSSWLPPTHPQNSVVLTTWGKWIEEATQGRVTMAIEYGMGHPKTMFNLVEDHVVDASWSVHGYIPGRFKLTEAAELPNLGVNAEAASVALWRINDKYYKQANEHDGLTLAALFTHGPGQIHLAQPIESLADMKNRKIRLGGGIQLEVGERMGVTAVSAPATKVYEMMQQGVIDGVFLPMSEHKYQRLKEIVKHVVKLPGGLYQNSFSIFMNPEFLQSLTKEDRDAIMSVSGEKLSALAGRAWDDADIVGLAEAKEAGVSILEVKKGDLIAQEFQAMIVGMDDDYLERVADRGIDAASALKEFREIARSYIPESAN